MFYFEHVIPYDTGDNQNGQYPIGFFCKNTSTVCSAKRKRRERLFLSEAYERTL